MLRNLALALLNDDHGIAEEAWLTLKEILLAEGHADIVSQVDATDGRFYLPNRFAELDSEDAKTLEAKTEEERLLNIEYRCPNCGHEWEEQWSCACDSECPACGTKDISALSWHEADQ